MIEPLSDRELEVLRLIAGGQVDFIRGAARAEGGQPIIALPATAKGATLSRIVPTLEPGSGVVTSRYDVHTIVTEYGVAQLYGQTLAQRAGIDRNRPPSLSRKPDRRRPTAELYLVYLRKRRISYPLSIIFRPAGEK